MTDLRTAAERAAAILGRPHRHDWRPDLVSCSVELDALAILRSALERQVTPDRGLPSERSDAGIRSGQGTSEGGPQPGAARAKPGDTTRPAARPIAGRHL